MKKYYFMLAAGMIAMSSQAKTTWQTPTLGTVTVDTLYHATVGPGTTQTQIHISYTRGGAAAESKVTYTTSDLTNPYLEIKTGVANQQAYGKPQTVKGMMSARTRTGKHYFAGVNGDFAGLGTYSSTPCGAMIENGIMVNGAAGLSDGCLSDYLVIDAEGKPIIAADIETVGGEVFGTVTYPNGAVENKLRFNGGRWKDEAHCYNQYYGYGDTKRTDGTTYNEPGHTNSNMWGVEAELLPVDNNFTYGKESEFVVGRVTKSAEGGNMRIPEGGLVLSTNGAANTNSQLLKAGDKVKVKYPFKADGADVSAKELIGGFGITVKGGELQTIPSKVPSDIAAKKPRARTAVGYNADKTTFIMAVVQEETSGGKNGMTIFEFGEVMQALGCTDALNLDGGGSSVMFVENLGQRNGVQNSYTWSRSVANGLFAVSNAPESRNVARIEFVDKSLTIKPGRGYQPVIYAYNEYGALISTGLQNYTLSADAATFDSSNRKMIAPESGKFALTANYNGITATIPVYVDAAGIEGSDPAAAPSFKGNEFVAMPSDWIDPEATPVYAELQDVTPKGYDFDKYDVKSAWKFAELPKFWKPKTVMEAPDSIYYQENMDADGQVTALHLRTVNSNDQMTFGKTQEAPNGDVLPKRQAAFTIQKHPNELVGNCLVFNQQWAPGASTCSWPAAAVPNEQPMQLTFYADPTTITATDSKHPVRVRLVFQVLYRGRHNQAFTCEIPQIYATSVNFAPAKNARAVNVVSHDYVLDNVTSREFPVDHTMNYKWNDEGTTIAEIPENPELYKCEANEIDAWDNGGKQAAGTYIMNGDRFIVYEFDVYGKPTNGTIAVHVNIAGGNAYGTYVFKEVKFFNVLNGAELLAAPKASKAPASRAANVEDPFVTTTAAGSLLGTRHISYRYYTPEGIKEIDAEKTNAGIDDVVVDGEDVEAPVEYYNLQGIRVENPANGIYIKRQGSKVTKVLVK